jgi:hypothetical protein
VSEGTQTPEGADGLPLRIAFYLPQFHQTPENDAWHGAGFTEWTVVVKSTPLFPGHTQPHLPGELGFYDLRLPEAREAQVRLARAYGISGFMYYHYWSTGQRMLERPFREVLRSGRPDFPFCLCWANESWSRRWQGAGGDLLWEQEYSEDDDVAHIRWLIDAFKDERYITVKGRPLLAIYRPMHLPDPTRTSELWRAECARAGVAEPWIVAFETYAPPVDPATFGFDANAEFVPHAIGDVIDPIEPTLGATGNTVFDYAAAARSYPAKPEPSWIRYPCVATGWDNTPRRRDGEAFLLTGSTPERYGEWLARSMRNQMATQGKDGVVFINAWNEWAEGAHLEPDLTHGRGYLEATRSVVQSLGGRIDGAGAEPDAEGLPSTAIEDLYAELFETLVQLRDQSSGYLAFADRRLQVVRQQHDQEMEALRGDNRRLAAWSLALEQQLAFVTRQRDEGERAAAPAVQA